MARFKPYLVCSACPQESCGRHWQGASLALPAHNLGGTFPTLWPNPSWLPLWSVPPLQPTPNRPTPGQHKGQRKVNAQSTQGSTQGAPHKAMGTVKLFPSPEYTSKQPKDPVVPKLPMTGILLGPSKSGKTVALISMILEQYRGCFERIYLFSPSINVDDGWRPVKKYIEETMKVPVNREQTYFEGGTSRHCARLFASSERSRRPAS